MTSDLKIILTISIIILAVALVFKIHNCNSHEGYFENNEYAPRSAFTGLYGGPDNVLGAGDYPVYSKYHSDYMFVDGAARCPFGYTRTYENGVSMCRST